MSNEDRVPLSSTDLTVEDRGIALELRGIVKHFGGVQAVRGVTVNVARREVLALLGENGAGKSTLVGVACGRLVPDSGQVLVDGLDITGMGPARASHAGVRLVPQELMLCKDMSVIDNVLLGQQPRLGGIFLNRDAARSETLRRLEVLGVTDLNLDASVGTLSVVDQAFVQIARAFTIGTKVLLIDEPTSPMDDREVDRFLAVLTKLKSSGTSIVYISHRLDEVFRLADRAAILRDGELVAELSGPDMTRQAVVSAMVGGRTLRDVRPEALRQYGEVALTCEKLSGRGVYSIDLTVKRGEIACIYGISGSGREEIGGLVAGAARSESGRVILGDAVLRRGSVADAVAHGMGYVPAERRTQGLILESAVASNMTLAVLKRLARLGFLAPSAPAKIARDWVGRLQIRTRSVKTPVGSLSGGSQQKVLLARWLVADSTVLVLEEPTRGVDVGTKAEIYHLLGELARQGKAVLVITSDIEEATLVSERVLVMRNGRIACELTSPDQEELALAAHGLTEEVSV